MKGLLFGFFFLLLSTVWGQECDCYKNLRTIEQIVELNQASYQHQVIEGKREEEYAAFKDRMNELGKRVKTQRDCIGLVALYQSFFRDEHSFLYYDEHFDPTRQSHKKAKIKEPDDNPLMGIWYFQDGTFSIQVFPYSTPFSQWSAVMVKDDSRKWKKGQVKIEFFEDDNQKLKCIYWRQNLVPKIYAVTVKDSVMELGRYLKFYRQKPLTDDFISSENIGLEWRVIDESTNYLKLPSFDLSQTGKIDSILKVHTAELSSKPNLIIDLRGNGGGGFDAFKPILPYILTMASYQQPYEGSVWVSDANLDYYDRTKYEFAETKQDSMEELAHVQYLQSYKGRFSTIEPLEEIIRLHPESPQKIAILQDRYTASTAEGLILLTKTSTKVETHGENTMGAVSYGDWMPVEIPELNIWIAITTKKMVFQQPEDFESIGIPPQHDLTGVKENEWIIEVAKSLEKR